MFLNSYIFILLFAEATVFGDAQVRKNTIIGDGNGFGNLSEYIETNSSFKPTLNNTNDFSTTESEGYDHIDDGDSWEDWIIQLLERFSGTIACIVVICVVFCIFCSLHCILQVREPS